MKILVFSELLYPHGGGAELATWLYSSFLSKRGFQITVVTQQFAGESKVETCNNVKVIRLPMKMVGGRYDTLLNLGLYVNRSIRNALQEATFVYIPGTWLSIIPLAKLYHKPVIIHLHNYSLACPTSLLYNFVTKTITPSSSLSFLLHERVERKRSLRGIILASLLNELFGKYYHKLGALADALIFVSHAQQKLILSRMPAITGKSHTISNPLPELPPITAETRGVGYFGGRSVVKGFPIILKALTAVKNTAPNPLEVYMSKTSTDHKTVPIKNCRVHFLPRLKHLASIMKKVSLVVLPSLWPEPLPYVVVEAMMFGKLVIASDVGGIPELVQGAGQGVTLIPPGDSEALGDAITHYMDLSLDESNALGLKNRDHIVHKVDNEAIITTFIKTLMTVQ